MQDPIDRSDRDGMRHDLAMAFAKAVAPVEQRAIPADKNVTGRICCAGCQSTRGTYTKALNKFECNTSGCVHQRKKL